MTLLNLRHIRCAQTGAGGEFPLGPSLLLPVVAKSGSEEREQPGWIGWLKGRGTLLHHILHPG
jgi:hypothetical protein